MSRKFIVGGNWKCNPATVREANTLLKEWKKALPNVDKSKVDVVICPPALWMSSLNESIEALGMSTCAQNVGKNDAGAFTGEWTASNLQDINISWTLIGHSERRTKYGESDADVAEKVAKCQDAGLNVILCIGETLEEREGGKTDEVNKRQLGAVIPKVKDWDKIVIAYEPVWAIGTGKVATPDQAEETQAAIRAYLKEAAGAAVADKVRIQYGGSVTRDNCAELITKPNIDGFLVGGASLKPTFMDIVSAVGPSKMVEMWPKYEEKMKKEGCNETAIAAFKYNYGVLVSGADVMIPESKLDPVDKLPEYEKLKEKPDPRLLRKTLILKLNGGLGTGMGLDKAKSLLTVTEGNSFLDLIAKQVANMKKSFKTDLKFMLMNSFSTSQDTLDALSKYSELGTGSDLEFVQNKAPKVTASDFSPADWSADSSHEWCPPGHGDLYPAMLGSGTLEKLLKKGFRYMFVSNSDNLGATMDLKILTHFVQSGAPFMMEVAERTDADKKGGHLAKDKATGGLLLRESAQCPEQDEKEFQNVGKYKFFNTNNLWVDLAALKREFRKNDGALPLPVMKNSKTVDPRDKASTKVLQLETAMGAAIQCFEGASALVIPRSRFAPVKTTNDLLALRSDAYQLTEDFTIVLAPERDGVPPDVKLDGMYKFADAMEKLIPNGAPSLIGCKKLVIEGPMTLAKGVVFKGTVTVKNSGAEKELAAGVYEDKTVEL
ncbi:UGP1 [Symbiodinium natans]|uniref:UGP1 protein n=1 Tax=Symbiodinium natans TaxID=878477 RepID=A0A812TJH8_9DINO|nr:UGP1 [Symbiodinium natans]